MEVYIGGKTLASAGFVVDLDGNIMPPVQLSEIVTLGFPVDIAQAEAQANIDAQETK